MVGTEENLNFDDGKENIYNVLIRRGDTLAPGCIVNSFCMHNPLSSHFHHIKVAYGVILFGFLPLNSTIWPIQRIYRLKGDMIVKNTLRHHKRVKKHTFSNGAPIHNYGPGTFKFHKCGGKSNKSIPFYLILHRSISMTIYFMCFIENEKKSFWIPELVNKVKIGKDVIRFPAKYS